MADPTWQQQHGVDDASLSLLALISYSDEGSATLPWGLFQPSLTTHSDPVGNDGPVPGRNESQTLSSSCSFLVKRGGKAELSGGAAADSGVLEGLEVRAG